MYFCRGSGMDVLSVAALTGALLLLATAGGALEEIRTNEASSTPVVITTWNYEAATAKAWETLQRLDGTALDAVEAGCALCEAMQCRGTVGYGGNPDEAGETTLDAMIMDGETMDVGGVGALRRVRPAVSVARKVLEHTGHSLLAGSQATDFAVQMGFKEESLATNKSLALWEQWKAADCQPNFWKDVHPDPTKQCGPYSVRPRTRPAWPAASNPDVGPHNHDTIGMCAIDARGRVAAGTSTNGARHKIPGRVGDSPIPGAGSYADQDVGAAAATGDGDVMMRFLPTFLAVELMRQGWIPQLAVEEAVHRMMARYPDFMGAVIALRKDGEYAAACHNLRHDAFPKGFPLTVRNPALGSVVIKYYKCI